MRIKNKKIEKLINYGFTLAVAVGETTDENEKELMNAELMGISEAINCLGIDRKLFKHIGRKADRWSDDEVKPKTAAAGNNVIDTIQNVRECICNNYCKYQDQAWTDEGELSEICQSCPLNLLQ